MKIALVTPAPTQVHTGNRTTADRWAGLLSDLRNQVSVQKSWDGEECDLLIALHARRSFPAIQRFRQEHPRAPLVVALTGTDLYRDLGTSVEAKRSLEFASRIVVLQELGVEAVPQDIRPRVRVIYQSFERLSPSPRREENRFASWRTCDRSRIRSERPLPYVTCRHLPGSR